MQHAISHPELHKYYRVTFVSRESFLNFPSSVFFVFLSIIRKFRIHFVQSFFFFFERNSKLFDDTKIIEIPIYGYVLHGDKKGGKQT